MGKASSKLKKRRTQSIAWSFRFRSSSKGNKKEMKPTIVVTSHQTHPHLAIDDWLARLELDQYKSKFKQFSGVEDILYLTEGDLHHMGIRNSAHRARMISSLIVLREKSFKRDLQRSNSYQEKSRTVKKPQRHSYAPENKRKSDLEPIYEILHVKSGKTSKSEGDLLDMGTVTPDLSQEAAALKKALEWELSLDTRDPRSHAWYHGPISRQRAEELLSKDEEFLIRDCTSQPGNYVVTCRSKGVSLHFVINKIILQPETVYERVQFQLEDDAYDTIADLITFYVGSGRPISAASGARISIPCNRTYPLSHFPSKYAGSVRGSPLQSPSPSGSFRSVFSQNPITYRSPLSSPPRTRRDIPPRLPSKKQQRSQSLTPLQAGIVANNQRNQQPEKYCSADGVITDNYSSIPEQTSEEQLQQIGKNTQSLPRALSAQAFRNLSLHSRTSSLTRDYSDSSLSPCIEQRSRKEPPPKPIRNSSLPRDEKEIKRDPNYRTSGSDSGNGSGDSAQSSATGEDTTPPRSGVIIRNPRYITPSNSSLQLPNCPDFDPVLIEQQFLQKPLPVMNLPSVYDLDTFQTVLLPFTENKPLDGETLQTLRALLYENGSLIIATHLTKVDIKLILGLGTEGAGASTDDLENGLELITLDYGRQFRLDLIERTECLKLLVATTVLTCTSDLERAETINKWIQIAIDTKTALGNLFGFCAIMLGLSMPQLDNLTNTWYILRQKFTDNAFAFEAKLRPTLKSMNDCTNPQAPNTTIPHLLPYILLRDRSTEEMLGYSQNQSSLMQSCVYSWENIAEDFGLSIMLAHFKAARSSVQNFSLYKTNAQIIMSDNSRNDQLLEEAFRTEFHMKFLWGSKGASVAAVDRHAKFEAVISAMAKKFATQNPNNDHTTTAGNN